MALDDDVLFSGVAALSRRIRARQLSPVELVDAVLARIEALAPRLDCFVTVTADRARAEAKAAEEELQAGRWRGPLHGIPYGLKDLVDTKGIRTTFGARPFAERVPGRDATVARRLTAAGAILVGKLSMIELAGGLGYRSAGAALNGPCRTPWDLARWAGGSSSGPGSAVAAGLVAFALGSETWGSITCPAAFCGVTGHRPTYGLVPRTGAMALSYTLDKLGPIARSAEDCTLVLDAIAGPDARDPSSISPPPHLGRVRPEAAKGLRIGVLGFLGAPPPVAGAREAFAAAQDVLRSAGALLEPASLPELPCEPLAALFVEAEGATALEDVIRTGKARQLADASHRTKSPADYLPKANAADYVRAMRVRAEVQRELARFFDRYDLVLAPNLPCAPPRVEESLDALFAAPDPLGAAGNVAGLPAIALPMGFSNGLPISMQLVGPPLEDVRVLSVAAGFQARTAFHRERPALAPPASPRVAVTAR